MTKRFPIRDFLADRDGAFAVMTAVMLPLFIMSAVFAADFASFMIRNKDMQKAIDNTALTIAQKYGDNPKLEGSDLTTQARDQLAALLDLDTISLEKSKVNISEIIIDGEKRKKVEITVVRTLEGITRNFVSTATGAAIASLATPENRKAFSIFFVTDTSGSMDDKVPNTFPQKTKMEVLKTSMKVILDDFKKKYDDKVAYIRTGRVFFNYHTYKELPKFKNPNYFQYINHDPKNGLSNEFTSPVLLDWGVSMLSASFDNDMLFPMAGTRIYPAIDIAIKALMNSEEDKAHAAKHDKNPVKSLIILSDGANAYGVDDTETLRACADAKKNNITISAMFFMTDVAQLAADNAKAAELAADNERAALLAAGNAKVAQLAADNARGEAILKKCVSSPSSFISASTPEELVRGLQMLGTAAIKSKARLLN